MAASKSPNPRLGKSQALNIAQVTQSRLATIIPTLPTGLSPVTVYQPGVSSSVGNELLAQATTPVAVEGTYGVWVAPDLNGDGSSYYVQVECFGGAGGGGGGNGTQGGAGGGGGEYACEDQYPVTPGQSYAYVVGLPGTAGINNHTQVNPGSAATNGGTTVFDIAGLGLAGGVVANGGTGADQTSIGIGGAGGTGSANSIHFNGGAGGTNNSSNGSDNPISLAQASGMFAGNTLSGTIIKNWYIMNDGPDTTFEINDQTFNGNNGKVTNYTGGLLIDNTAAPTQVPAYFAPASPPLIPNPTAAGLAPYWKLKTAGQPSSRIAAPAFTFSGTHLTLSTWLQADPSGTWGGPLSGSYAVVAANGFDYFLSTPRDFKGFALFLHNSGSLSNPNWQLYFMCGDGTSAHSASVNTALVPTPGTWYYVVATFNSGTLTLYVNTVNKGTASTTYTSQPAGSNHFSIGMDPQVNGNGFYGYMSNMWWATDVATTSLLAQASGTTPATGGAGGGASGGPSAAGGNGAPASGATGGAGGTPATQPVSLAATTTQAMGGYAGASANSGDSPSTPAGGPYGGGGGGSGDMTASPALTVLTIPFSSAATYAGVDASSNPGTPYNTNQQNNPNSGLNSVLFAGGLPSDSGSGSKNSIMLLPSNLKAQLGNTIWTISQITLTVTNAYPANAVESVLELGYSSDTQLPQTYFGTSLVEYVGAIEIPVGAGTIVYDLTQSDLGAELQNGTATALVLGPGANPTFDAYNSATGPEFYASIYGPGAFDTSGNPQFPFLTITLEKTLTTQEGSSGQGGAILITTVETNNLPVSAIEPFPATDAGGNKFAEGYTGQVTSFDPSQSAGSMKPEVWHNAAGFSQTGWTVVTLRYRMLPDGATEIQFSFNITTAATATGTITLFTLPSSYWPAVNFKGCAPGYFTNATTWSSQINNMRFQVTTSGVVQILAFAGGVSPNLITELDGSYRVPLL